MTLRAAINKGLLTVMEDDERVVLIGQSIRDPFGGACKVTRGLTKRFDSRVIDLPISEDATIGMSIGMATAGAVPVVEVMFSDFMTLAVNQIWNVADKIEMQSPVVIRTLFNAGEAYGPTHSQDMYALLRILPSASVQYVNPAKSVSAQYRELILGDGAKVRIMVEDKQAYDKEAVA